MLVVQDVIVVVVEAVGVVDMVVEDMEGAVAEALVGENPVGFQSKTLHSIVVY